jgi:hypothetical protein
MIGDGQFYPSVEAAKVHLTMVNITCWKCQIIAFKRTGYFFASSNFMEGRSLKKPDHAGYLFYS